MSLVFNKFTHDRCASPNSTQFAITFWLGDKTEEFTRLAMLGQSTDSEVDEFLIVYGILAFSSVLAMVGQGVVSAKAMLTASETMHARLTNSVLHAPLAFFVRPLVPWSCVGVWLLLWLLWRWR